MKQSSLIKTEGPSLPMTGNILNHTTDVVKDTSL